MREFSDLLARAQAADRDALDEIHRRYEPLVLARIRRELPPVLRRHCDTLDLGQSVFLEVLRDLPAFEDRGEEAFRHWVFIKAENKVRARLRKHLGPGGRRRATGLRTDDESALAARGDGPAEAAADTDDRRRVRELAMELESPDREIVAMRVTESARFDVIARRVGLPGADAARKRYARALVEIRRRWRPG